jgi:hypothetical protein
LGRKHYTAAVKELRDKPVTGHQKLSYSGKLQLWFKAYLALNYDTGIPEVPNTVPSQPMDSKT